jgi:chromosome segregation ATPase
MRKFWILAAACAALAGRAGAQDAAPAAAPADAAVVAAQAVAPAAPEDPVKAARQQLRDLERKIEEAGHKLQGGTDVAPLAKARDEAKKAYESKIKEKTAADPVLSGAKAKRDEIKAKLAALGADERGRPKDAAATLTDAQKAEVEALLKQAKELNAQTAAAQKALDADAELAALKKASEDARKARDEALKAKLAADPEGAKLIAERDALAAKIKELEQATRPAKQKK